MLEQGVSYPLAEVGVDQSAQCGESALRRDCPDLVTQRDRVNALTGGARGQEHLTRVEPSPRLATGERHDGQQTGGLVEGFVTDHEDRTPARLFVAGGG